VILLDTALITSITIHAVSRNEQFLRTSDHNDIRDCMLPFEQCAGAHKVSLFML
jgi:hypothetical protein